ncbi:LysR family transcriptional regulator [Yinghuangia soli]|uniref:LysR family transcriptional regulator n=1 Tax=Yinghuangia soli TaxID=2908204 RepID=A0AA41U748_9ACTN|nr:LysR family transcriptional regulator [Yinghuangia soli]MCF2531614.1 LysR family transcriptional regulator [Yinghuangia soli]
MERQDIEIFLVLAEELHFGRTADRLFLSTALVSKTIKRIERQLGVRLFDRSSRHVMLTDIGRRLRADLHPHQQGIQQALERARLARNDITGTLAVGFMSVLAGTLVVQGRHRFRAEHPQCDVRVVETQVHHFVSQLRDGTVDVLLMSLPVDEPDIRVGPVVARRNRVVVASADHRFAGMDSVSWEDLAGETLPTAVPTFPDYAVDFHAPPRTPSGRRIERFTEPVATYLEALTMVSAGRMLVLGDTQLAQYYNRPDLVYLPVHDLPPLEFALLWRTCDDDDPRIRAFVAATVAAAPRTGP